LQDLAIRWIEKGRDMKETIFLRKRSCLKTANYKQ
jgi:hypothetical protein